MTVAADPQNRRTPAAPGTRENPTQVREFRLPDLGEGLTESEIVRWHIEEGDTVELNQIIADVETAKAVVELPSPYAGVVLRLHEDAGTVVEVGTPIVSFTVPGASAVAAGSAPGPVLQGGDDPQPEEDHPEEARPEDAVPPSRREPNLVGYGAAVEKGGRPRRRSRSIPGSTVDAVPEPSVPEPSVPPEPSPHLDERPRSTPPVRKLARDLGVSLGGLTGSGPGELITRADVLAALADTPASAGQAGRAGRTGRLGRTGQGGEAGQGGGVRADEEQGTAMPGRTAATGETRTPIRGIRKLTAAAMVASAFTAPHATEFLTVDVTPTLDLLEELRNSPSFAGVRVTPLSIVAKAVCIAVARNPSLNSSWDEQAQEIVQYAGINLGIAAATPRGLLVPNIKGAGGLTLVELARALGDLTETARAGKTSPAALAGGTLSITNVGVFGIDAGTPILTPGEAAILAVGAVRRAPWEYQDAVALRSVLTLSLSFDHRLVDGAEGSRFLADVGIILSRPAMVLAMI